MVRISWLIVLQRAGREGAERLLTSWIGGICKEIGDWLHPLDSDT
jgi:hypothetical protein